MKKLLLLLIYTGLQATQNTLPYRRQVAIPKEMSKHFNKPNDAFFSDVLLLDVSAKDELTASLSFSGTLSMYKRYDPSKIHLAFNPQYWHIIEKGIKEEKVKRGAFPKDATIQTIYSSLPLQSFIGLVAQLNKKSRGQIDFLGTKISVISASTPDGLHIKDVKGGSQEDNKGIQDLLSRYLCVTKSKEDKTIMLYRFKQKAVPINYEAGNVLLGVTEDIAPGMPRKK